MELLLFLSGKNALLYSELNILFRGEEFAAVEERYHLTPKCWVLDTTDALNILQLV